MTILWKAGGTQRVPKMVPPIPLEKPEKKALTKGEYHTYKLRSMPTEANSPIYELSIPFFGTGMCEEYLVF